MTNNSPIYEKNIDKEWLTWCLVSVMLSFLFVNYYILGVNYLVDHLHLPAVIKRVNMLFATPFFLISGVLTVAARHGKLKSLLQIIQLKNWRYYYIPEGVGLQLLLFAPLAVITYSVMNVVNTYLKPVFPKAVEWITKSSEATQAFAISSDWNVFAIFAITAIVVAPIVEEIVFRGVIFSFFKQYTTQKTAIIVTSLLFAALHMNILQFIPLFILGAIFQLLFIYHKSLYPGIIYHSINNSFSVLVISLIKLGLIDIPQ